MIESARRRAVQLGDPLLAPPLPLERCLRDTVELALAKPQAGFEGHDLYPDLAAKTAALMYGLSKSQACAEGNKRVALLLTLAFVRNNGADLTLRPDEMADEILRVADTDPADHDAVVASLTQWVAARLVEGIR